MAISGLAALPPDDQPSTSRADLLVSAARELAGASRIDDVARLVRRAARALTGADGVTFVLREGDHVHYADEDAIAPLWKGSRFPANACISGWAMLHRETVAIEDIFADPRIPHDLYRPTFVRSLAMVPVVADEPVAAIGAYWARRHHASGGELRDLESLAGLASVALVNVRLQGELRAAVRARDEFIAIASHELRSPLTAVQMQVELAARALAGEPDVEALRRGLDRARRGTARLGALVDRLLDVSRVVQNRLELDREPVALADAARAAVERLREVSPKARVELSIDADPHGSWDRSRIEQSIENLVANAVKFGGDAPVRVRVAEDGPWAVVAVTDGGIGIAPEDQARIFEPFERAVSTRHYGGFGLGLWIVRQTVEAHGGAIAIESRPGAGSTFTVRLPRS